MTVAANPDEADERLEFAADCLAGASQELARGQSGAAALLLQAAEAGADQATDLLSGIEQMEAELTQAASAPARLRCARSTPRSPRRRAARGRQHDERARWWPAAQAVAADVRARQAAGPFDALAALRDVQQADAALDSRAGRRPRSEQAGASEPGRCSTRRCWSLAVR